MKILRVPQGYHWDRKCHDLGQNLKFSYKMEAAITRKPFQETIRLTMIGPKHKMIHKRETRWSSHKVMYLIKKEYLMRVMECTTRSTMNGQITIGVEFITMIRQTNLRLSVITMSSKVTLPSLEKQYHHLIVVNQKPSWPKRKVF